MCFYFASTILSFSLIRSRFSIRRYDDFGVCCARSEIHSRHVFIFDRVAFLHFLGIYRRIRVTKNKQTKTVCERIGINYSTLHIVLAYLRFGASKRAQLFFGKIASCANERMKHKKMILFLLSMYRISHAGFSECVRMCVWMCLHSIQFTVDVHVILVLCH